MKSELYEPGKQKLRVHRSGRTGIVATVSAVLCATSLLAVPAANAAVPTFPDNLVVFPNRDFVTIEGYQDHVGETALVEVTRAGAGVIGSAKGVVAAGDVAFEINHPGGMCWGAGTGLNVTPDIQPGDVVSIKFGDVSGGETRVQETYVTEDSILSGSTVIVKGHVGTGVNRDQMEQRIVEPALKDTAVGRRDIRAVAGPQTPAPKGGYTSALEFDVDGPNTFTATYIFDDPATAGIAASAAGERAMAWQEAGGAENRQGLTIAEFGEPGGPGMGGCPNGPLQSGPAGPTDVSAAKVDGGLALTWTPARAIPGTPAITGYRATAVSKNVSDKNEQVEIGMRLSGQSADRTTIKGLTAGEDYDVYVVAVSSIGETYPAIHATPTTDTTAPTVTASSNGGSFSTAQQLTLTAPEPGADIYYTTDKSEPFLSGGVTAEFANRYTGPINVTANGSFTFAAIDAAGNVSETRTVDFSITNDPVPAAPAFTGAPTAGKGTANISWTAPNPGAPGLDIRGYTVQAYTAAGTAFGAPKPLAGNITTLTYGGLNGDTVYQFTVRASNTHGTGPESAKSAPVTVQGDVVANAGANQTIARRTTSTTVTLDGTGSTAGATYKWEQVLTGPADPDKVTLNATTASKTTFSLPVYKYPMTNNPLTFRLTVTVGADVRTADVKVMPVPDKVTIDQAQWKSGDMRINGTSTVAGGIVTIRVGGPTGRSLGTAAVTAAAAPATGGVYSLRLRNAAAGTTNPGSIWIESTTGGTLGPVAVVNK